MSESNKDPLVPLVAILRDLVLWLKAGQVSGVVIGGIAASILGRPRVTRDVDAVVLLDEGNWPKFLEAGARFGFIPRRPDVLTFAKRARVFLVRHEPSGIDADIAIGSLPFEREAVMRLQWIPIGGVDIPLPTPEDLIVMKAVANRPRDLGDIEGILDANPKLDLRRVRRWVREFSSALESPEILKNFNAIITARRRSRR